MNSRRPRCSLDLRGMSSRSVGQLLRPTLLVSNWLLIVRGLVVVVILLLFGCDNLDGLELRRCFPRSTWCRLIWPAAQVVEHREERDCWIDFCGFWCTFFADPCATWWHFQFAFRCQNASLEYKASQSITSCSHTLCTSYIFQVWLGKEAGGIGRGWETSGSFPSPY